jgi:mannitol/fructose-specific phosphotransferase system IIA component (Ntr-type)
MDRIERLKESYKRLLDAGRITQEQYDEAIKKLEASHV